MPSEPINYKDLILRLTAHACRFLGVCQTKENEQVIEGTGSSPEDFAIHVVELFAVGKLPHEDSKGTGGLIRHLTVAMEHDILDALDRAEHKLGQSVDDVPSDTDDRAESRKTQVAELRAEAHDPVTYSDGEAFKATIYSLTKDDRDLTEMAVAIFEVNALKPREIAEVCMTTPADIQNRKKRFGRILRDHGHYQKKARPL